MAEALLRAWQAPETVSALVVDAAGPRVVHAEHTAITGLTASNGGLAWTAHDAALPIAQRLDDGTMELVAAAGGNIAGLDRQTIAVRGLAPGRYRLVIDDDQPGKAFTADELAAGIDLGGAQTPMVWQAMGIRWASDDKNIVHEQWMHAMQRSAKDPDQVETARRLEAVEATLTAEREASRWPMPHRFTVTRATTAVGIEFGPAAQRREARDCQVPIPTSNHQFPITNFQLEVGIGIGKLEIGIWELGIGSWILGVGTLELAHNPIPVPCSNL